MREVDIDRKHINDFQDVFSGEEEQYHNEKKGKFWQLRGRHDQVSDKQEGPVGNVHICKELALMLMVVLRLLYFLFHLILGYFCYRSPFLLILLLLFCLLLGK